MKTKKYIQLLKSKGYNIDYDEILSFAESKNILGKFNFIESSEKEKKALEWAKLGILECKQVIDFNYVGVQSWKFKFSKNIKQKNINL